MSFTYPAFLFALSAIAIPVIIHLFNFRKFKTVYFSNVRFLREVKEETQAKSKLKHLLVLFCRILAIIFLVLAFAQPFIPTANRVQKGDKAISIFVDNSFSMEAKNKNGSLLDDAKKRALEIISAYKPGDRFHLFTNDFEGRHQRLINKEEFVEFLDALQISSSTRMLSEINARALDILEKDDIENKALYILSDFQKSLNDFNLKGNDTSVSVRLLPLFASTTGNVYIDSCWFETPVRQSGQTEHFHVRIQNQTDKPIENNSIRLFINNIQKSAASYSVEANSESTIVITFVSREVGIQHCRVELTDYPVTFDDTFYFSFKVNPGIPVLAINENEESSYLHKLFNDSSFTFTNTFARQIDFSAFARQRFIILNEIKSFSTGLLQELQKFVENGGSILVFPSEESDLNSYKELSALFAANNYERLDTINTRVNEINLEHEIYKGVFEKSIMTAQNLDLPYVSSHYVFSKRQRSTGEFLLKLQNGDAFLTAYRKGKGRIYLCASSISGEASNFVKHAVFVPSLFQMAIFSQETSPLYYTVGRDEIIESSEMLGKEKVFHLKNTITGYDLIPEFQVNEAKTEIIPGNQIKEAGNYDLLIGEERAEGISYNYDRKESVLKYYSVDDLLLEIEGKGLGNFSILENQGRSISNLLAEMEHGKKMWKYCLILALIFFAGEILLLRFMK